MFGSIDDVDCGFFEECKSDKDCDDGLFCNGEETCNGEGMCEMGTPPCDGDFPVCDELDDICVTCDPDLGDGDWMICHIPDDRKDHTFTIIVGQTALPAHLDHGDRLGPCNVDCPDPGGD